MMTTNEEGRCLKHDTTMCGDPKVWFPMRVTYSRELKVEAELDRGDSVCAGGAVEGSVKKSSLRKGPEGFIHFLVLPGLRGK